MHNDGNAVGAEPDVELDAVDLRGTGSQGLEAVLEDLRRVGAAMRQQDRQVACRSRASDRAGGTDQGATPPMGSEIVNVVPTPGVEATEISPP